MLVPTETEEAEVEEVSKMSSLWTMENFYAPDDEASIVMDGDFIKAATLPKLIAYMTADRSSVLQPFTSYLKTLPSEMSFCCPIVHLGWTVLIS